ncbi:MAG: hypothetical protein GC181_01755 [Bacteroidetes bacterium]|nr:hypothetical protein [Bacteroidota bacterium]
MRSTEKNVANICNTIHLAFVQDIDKHMKIRVVILSFFFLVSGFTAYADFDFYGYNIELNKNNYRLPVIAKPFQQKNISISLASLPATLINDLVQNSGEAKSLYSLDDLGLIQYVKKASASLSSDASLANLISYRVLKAMNYSVVLTYTQSEVSLFGELAQQPAEAVYIFYENHRYTNLNFRDSRIKGERFVFKSVARPDVKTIHIDVENTPNLHARLKTKTVSWYHQGKIYSINSVSNASLTEYLRDLPQLPLGKEYIETGCSQEFENTVLKSLQSQMSSLKSETEKASFLLHFVQSAFGYETDQEQYGHEKYNFPEETVAADFSDCEDRTLLLAFLYKRLLGLNSIALYFEFDKHICLAVALPNHSNNYSLKYLEQPYVLCEPTGDGFELGQSGLELSRITEVIKLF